MVALDYLQLLTSGESRPQRRSGNFAVLKLMAREMQVLVIAPSHLNHCAG